MNQVRSFLVGPWLAIVLGLVMAVAAMILDGKLLMFAAGMMFMTGVFRIQLEAKKG